MQTEVELAPVGQSLMQLDGVAVESWPAAATLKVLDSNPTWGAPEFSKLTFISRNSAACQSNAT